MTRLHWLALGLLLGLGVLLYLGPGRPATAQILAVPGTRNQGELSGLRLFEGTSSRGQLQEALDSAVRSALSAQPGADRLVRYRVREIAGEQGGIRGQNAVRVTIEVRDEERVAPPGDLPRADSPEVLRRALDTTLRLSQDEVRVGQPVTLEFRVRNTANRPVRILFPSGQTYDFVALRGTEEVWRWSQDRAFTQALRVVPMRPGETLTFRETWNQRNQRGQQVPPGTYVVRGILTAGGEAGAELAPLGDTAPLTIRR